MDFFLVVVKNFADHECGDVIDDETAIGRIIGGEYVHHVVKVARRNDHDIKQEG